IIGVDPGHKATKALYFPVISRPNKFLYYPSNHGELKTQTLRERRQGVKDFSSIHFLAENSNCPGMGAPGREKRTPNGVAGGQTVHPNAHCRFAREALKLPYGLGMRV
ncbi:MAG TPA: hypothetical protein VN673_18395, partial [Clostridia bacterium]|nr:hypothetical protein [Clostridia bacterium]